MIESPSIETKARSAEQEIEAWLCKTLHCEIDWYSDEWARFDLALYPSDACVDESAIPYGFAEAKERFFPKDRYETFLLDRIKFEYARSIWQTEKAPCYLATAWLDYYGFVDLTKLSDSQVTYGWGWVSDPMLGWQYKALVYIPISFFTIYPRGTYPNSR